MFLNRLKQLRASKNVTQEVVAEAVGISVAKYRNYELQNSKPAPIIIVKLAQYFGVSTDYLLMNSDFPFPLDNRDFKLMSLIKKLPPEDYKIMENLSPDDVKLLRLIHELPQEYKDCLLKLEPDDVELALYLKKLPENPVPYVISDTLIGIPKDSDPKAINALRDYIEFILHNLLE